LWRRYKISIRYNISIVEGKTILGRSRQATIFIDDESVS
jgi:hypothetical protein